MLKTLTLRCANEAPDPAALLDAEHYNSSVHMHRTKKTSGRFTSGKIGPCARDMVGECRKCSEIVCRVCRSRSLPFVRTKVADIRGRTASLNRHILEILRADIAGCVEYA
jgi:hypothetical protein